MVLIQWLAALIARVKGTTAVEVAPSDSPSVEEHQFETPIGWATIKVHGDGRLEVVAGSNTGQGSVTIRVNAPDHEFLPGVTFQDGRWWV